MAGGLDKDEAIRTGRELLEFAALLLAYVVVTSLLGIGCPIRFVTGISCPGCGMTRAWLEFLQFNPVAALAYHPLFWTVPVAMVLAVVPARGLVARRVRMALMLALCGALIVLWVIRMADPCDLMLLGDLAGPGDVVNWGSPGWM